MALSKSSQLLHAFKVFSKFFLNHLLIGEVMIYSLGLGYKMWYWMRKNVEGWSGKEMWKCKSKTSD